MERKVKTGKEFNYMKYSFKFKLFGGKVQMFSEGQMGVVIEKEPDVVCVYGTDQNHRDILCAIPLCHPKLLKGAEYTVDFCSGEQVQVCVGDLQIVIDYGKKKCASNKSLTCYGSDRWGQDVQTNWSELR